MATIEKRPSKKTNKVSYRARVCVFGYPKVSKTFPTKTAAETWAKMTEAKMLQGANFSIIESQKHTVAELADLYEKHLQANPKKASVDTIRHIRMWKSVLGQYALSSLTPSLLIQARNQIAESKDARLQKKKSNAIINRYMAALSVILSYAVRELEWLENNPVVKISKLSEPRGRVRYLSDEERENLLAETKKANNPYLHPAVLIGITTGARRMEILSLKWQDVDLNAGRAILQDTKNGERRYMPLAGPALVELRKLYANRKPNDIYVFPSHDGTKPFDIQRSWYKAMADAGLKNFHFHDLRHTCASYLVMNGYSMAEIAAILGHKTLQMTKRYAHLSDEHSQTIVETMANKIFGETDQ